MQFIIYMGSSYCEFPMILENRDGNNFHFNSKPDKVVIILFYNTRSEIPKYRFY